MASIESYEQLLRAVQACEDKKAEDIRILALDPTESGLSDYFVICSGTNTRQNVAITDEVELQLKRTFGVYPNSVEGRREGDWILMDYVDFILHVFTPEKREFYGLERLRKSATTVSADELDAELKAKVKEARAKSATAAKADAGGEPEAQEATKPKRTVKAKATAVKDKPSGAGTGSKRVVTKVAAKAAAGKKPSAKQATRKTLAGEGESSAT